MTISQYFDTPGNRRELFDFYAEAYPTKPLFCDMVWFEWWSERTVILLGRNEAKKIIAHNALKRRTQRIDGAYRETFATTNLIVLPEYAGHGYGRELVRHSRAISDAVWGTGSTDAALHVLPRAGLGRFDGPKMCLLPIDGKECMRMARFGPLASKIGGPLLTKYAKMKSQRVQNHSVVRDIECREVDRFYPDTDAYWIRYLSDYGMFSERDAATLNHKYVDKPDGFHFIHVYGHPKCPVGYCVTRLSAMTPHDNGQKILLGRIVDIVFAQDIDGLGTVMVEQATDRLSRFIGVSGIVGLGSTSALLAAYRDNGMVITSPRPASTDIDMGKLKRKYRDPWYLTLGDADLDDYE